MTQVILDRFKSDEQGTFGMMTLDGEQLCFTCELPWLDNEPDKSCIPPGEYICVNYHSLHFPDVWQLSNVPGRKNILIHNGNSEADTHGCILVGDSMGKLNGVSAVLNSVKTLHSLKSKLPSTFTLTITGD